MRKIKENKQFADFFKYVLVAALIVIVATASLVAIVLQRGTENGAFVGVEVGYDNFEDFARFVDEVEDYVNLIVIGSLNITTNATRLTMVCDYLYSKGLYFMPFMFITQHVDKADFFNVAKERWGEKFLGVYLSDEPGGRQFDTPDHRIVAKADNYSDAASKYVGNLGFTINYFLEKFGEPDVKKFTSDYALYWFDYLAGYDCIFAEFGWNFSRQLHIALCRGAATVQNKDWGVIITWTYRKPPYIEDAETLYKDMVLAYNNGAKYIIVFNYPTNVTQYGILTKEHLNSMRRFWNYAQKFPQPTLASKVAYVLPKNYGYGFRGPHDQIWGLWISDELSPKIWNDINSLLASSGTKLDIIYDTEELSREHRYERLIFWNDSTIQW
ncbi:MAG: hypothetical protein ACPLKQ_05310 [Candidatus Bathyarchaeales archaeon]